MPPSADNFLLPHINTQAEKIEGKDEVLAAVFVYPSVEVVNHKIA